MIFPLSDLTPTVSFLRAACFWLNTGSRVFPAGKTPDGISASEAITYGYQSADFGNVFVAIWADAARYRSVQGGYWSSPGRYLSSTHDKSFRSRPDVAERIARHERQNVFAGIAENTRIFRLDNRNQFNSIQDGTSE
jgi:hypothetical protein